MIAGGRNLGGIYGHSEPYSIYETSEPYELCSLGLGGLTNLRGASNISPDMTSFSGGYQDFAQKAVFPVGLGLLVTAGIIYYLYTKKNKIRRF